MPITSSPNSVRSAGGDDRFPSVTSVPGESATSPPHCRPMSATSSPIPTAMACFSEAGMATINRSRNPMAAVRMNSVPAIATAPRAMRHGTFIATQTVNAKKKL